MQSKLSRRLSLCLQYLFLLGGLVTLNHAGWIVWHEQDAQHKFCLFNTQDYTHRMLLNLKLGTDISGLIDALTPEAIKQSGFLMPPDYLPQLSGIPSEPGGRHHLKISLYEWPKGLLDLPMVVPTRQLGPWLAFYYTWQREAGVAYRVITRVQFSPELVYAATSNPGTLPFDQTAEQPEFKQNLKLFSQVMEKFTRDFGAPSQAELKICRAYTPLQLRSLKSHLIIVETLAAIYHLQHETVANLTFEEARAIEPTVSAATFAHDQTASAQWVKKLDWLEEQIAGTWLSVYTPYASLSFWEAVRRYNLLQIYLVIGLSIAGLLSLGYFGAYRVGPRTPFLLNDLLFDDSEPACWERRLKMILRHPLYPFCPITSARGAERIRHEWAELGRRVLEQETELRRRRQSEESMRRNAERAQQKQAGDRRKSCETIAEQAKKYWHKLTAYNGDDRDVLIEAYAISNAGADRDYTLNQRLTTLELLRKAFDPPKPPPPPPPPALKSQPPPSKREQVEMLRAQLKTLVGDELPGNILDLAPRYLEILIELVPHLQELEPDLVPRFLGRIASLEKPGLLLEGEIAAVIRRRKLGPIRQILGLSAAPDPHGASTELS